MLPKIIVILGPTGSGKSKLAILLAQKFKGEIISADSRQIYKGFIIGSGLVEVEWQKIEKKKIYLAGKIPHHLVQFLEPEQDFSVAEYKKLALEKIRHILKKGKVPFLVGGTGLYLEAVLENLTIPEIKPNLALRKKLEEKSKEELFCQLKMLDPESAQNIDKQNKRRLVRALEVNILGKTTFSQSKTKGPKLFDVLKIGLLLPRPKLYQNIDRRMKQMINDGLIQEVEDLLKLYPKTAPAFSGIGYKETIEYLENKINKSALVQKIRNNTHAYARRQITWFKKDREIKWVKNEKETEKLVKDFLLK